MYPSWPDAISCEDGSGGIFYFVVNYHDEPNGYHDYGGTYNSNRVYEFDNDGVLRYEENPACSGITVDVSTIEDFENYSFSGGGGSSSPYIIDIGTTLMLGGLLTCFIAYWTFGLIRRIKN